MIRFVIGILLMLGVAGAIENCPPDVSVTHVAGIAVTALVGFGMLLSAAKATNV